MSKKWMLLAIFAILSAEFYAQRSTIELTFAAVNGTVRVQLDRVMIFHSTLPGLTTNIYWPDTTFSLEYNPGRRCAFCRLCQHLLIGHSGG